MHGSFWKLRRQCPTLNCLRGSDTHKLFPIAGCAVFSLGLFLLSSINAQTARWCSTGMHESIATPEGNFDHRSFGLNDEVNIAVLDVTLAGRLLQAFERDLAQSTRLTYEHWQTRSVALRVLDSLVGLFEREE